MDLVRPDLTAKVERHQQSWKDRSDRGACDRQFQVGEEVYATAIPQVEQRWVPAVVTSVEGQSCEIRLLDGRVFRRHHLRTRHAPAPEEDQTPGWRQPAPPAPAPRLPQAPSCPAAVAPPLPLPEDPPSPVPETQSPPPPAAQSPVREASLPPITAPAPRRSVEHSAPQHPLPLSPVVGSAAGQRTLRPQRSRRAPIRLDL